jgi:hypothetical protein
LKQLHLNRRTGTPKNILEHLPPEQLAKDVLAKEHKIVEIMN